MTGSAREVIAREAFDCTESTKEEAHYFAEWLDVSLREAGFAVVPVEPTQHMVNAATGIQPGDIQNELHSLEAERHEKWIKDNWRKMLTASQKAKDNE